VADRSTEHWLKTYKHKSFKLKETIKMFR